MLVSTSALADTVLCGSIRATTGITGEQLVQLTNESGVFSVVSGPTENLEVQKKLDALKKSLKPEPICVKTIYAIIDNTILATGFTKFETGH